ncbi:uncharacterized protein LOC115620203 [Scaptodrosophila lebanonensis]|uniref:Uncharacterized protein LOC115620203 n=1 Tax=Drosophila lebanonensis TaxID=7225 RepID=A0A6J2T1X7_DROLE|nr:uncharacterized protein LOC115620203 [Scaptodrosophila lebanonensis]
MDVPRVPFRNYGEELPKLTFGMLNGEELCHSPGYDPPSTVMSRYLNISVSTYKDKTELRPSSGEFASGGGRESKSGAASGSHNITVNKITQDSPASHQCGVEGFVGLQVDGEAIPHGRFPWMAALYHDDDPDPKKLPIVWEKKLEELRIYVGCHDLSSHPETGAIVMDAEVLHASELCVKCGPCMGDSGAGLMIKHSGKWMLRAIISLAQRSGNSCDLFGYVILL